MGAMRERGFNIGQPWRKTVRRGGTGKPAGKASGAIVPEPDLPDKD